MREDRARPPRDDVVVAATRIFSQLGYHGSSMEDIAAALGMRKASLYHHVRSKEDLLFVIHEALIEQLISAAAPIATSNEP
ncbi:MAG TPA: helix-turn-helix domain-containing protein, partial [Acidimicrobiia bacterium]|nr:helix-turn-helix domain-containing protein [Acidimicrobiia bacterium]